MTVRCGILVRNLHVFSSSNRHLFGTSFAGCRQYNSTRAFSTAPHDQKSSLKEIENEEDGAIKFSTSKASGSVWSVEKALGGGHQKPWWKVLPLSLAAIAFLVWCILRKETEVDRIMGQTLSDHFPDLILSEAEPEEDAKKPNKTT